MTNSGAGSGPPPPPPPPEPGASRPAPSARAPELRRGWWRTFRRRTPALQPTQEDYKRRTAWLLSGIVAIIYLVGLAAIVVFSFSTNGKHLQYVGVGILTALAATLTGTFFGFLVGVPRQVSSGSVRLGEAARDARSGDGGTPDAGARNAGAAPDTTEDSRSRAGRAARFSQSTNLAEISDWLTKLLLGAGLVSLTKLGRPLGQLINRVAGGLVAGDVTGTAKVMAGSIMIAYVILGFIVAYVITTSWYSRVLEGA